MWVSRGGGVCVYTGVDWGVSGLDVMNAWINVSVEMERWRDTGEKCK